MKQRTANGLWLMEAGTLDIRWIGMPPVPRPTLGERLHFAALYIRSNGHGPTFIDRMMPLAKSVIFCLNPSHVSLSGKSYRTTGSLNIPAEWRRKLTEWGLPQTGHGSADSLAERSSNCS